MHANKGMLLGWRPYTAGPHHPCLPLPHLQADTHTRACTHAQGLLAEMAAGPLPPRLMLHSYGGSPENVTQAGAAAQQGARRGMLTLGASPGVLHGCGGLPGCATQACAALRAREQAWLA